MQVRSRCSIALLIGATVAAMLSASFAAPAVAAKKQAASKQTAAKRSAQLTFSPRKPFDNQPITVTWKADHGPRHLYDVSFTIQTGDHQRCGSDSYLKPKRTWKKGSTVRVTFTPFTEKVWCAGEAVVDLYENGRIIASAKLPISDNTSTPPPDPPGPNERLTLVEGSTLTVSAPGHADRTGALTGSLTGRGRLPNVLPGAGLSDPSYTYVRSGSLTVAGLPTDPLCSGAAVAYPQTLGVNITHSTIMWQSDVAYVTVVTKDDPLAMTGCPGATAPAVGRPILLITVPGEQPRRSGGPPIRLHGVLTGLRLSDGADATIRFDVNARLEMLQPGQE